SLRAHRQDRASTRCQRAVDRSLDLDLRPTCFLQTPDLTFAECTLRAMTDPASSLVTVTSISGFIALHCARELLERGYRVRSTLRDRARKNGIHAALGNPSSERLSFAQAELTRDDDWKKAMTDATYVLHVASPLPKAAPKHEDELVVPARE